MEMVVNTSAKTSNVITLLKQVEGHSLPLTEVSAQTGMSILEVKKEIQRLASNGENIAYYKGVVFIPANTKEFPIYTLLFMALLTGFYYITFKHFFG